MDLEGRPPATEDHSVIYGLMGMTCICLDSGHIVTLQKHGHPIISHKLHITCGGSRISRTMFQKKKPHEIMNSFIPGGGSFRSINNNSV